MRAKFEKAIVVGASSGIGRAIVERLAGEGARVVALARRKDRLDELADRFPGRVLAMAHDVTAYDTVEPAFLEATRWLGGLDLVVYASGVMPEVTPETYDFDKDRAMVEVNLLGAIAWLNLAALRFRGERRGTILGIGSVAGDRGRAGQPVYNATKAALACYLESLRNRLSRYGVRVVTVKPGPVQTEMTARLHLRNAMSAERAAEIILRKAYKNGEHYLKFSHRVIFFVIRAIPSPLFRRLRI